MSMEIRDEAMGRAAAAAANNSSSSANSECSHPIVKGKRTKRQRVHQSPATAASSTSSSSGDLSGTATEEDEDMANCLILLAQGRSEQLAAGPKSEATALQKDGSDGSGGERFTSRRLAEAATTNGKPGFYIYECKTCNKCFPSFQALGGHRSSHKKPKMVPEAAATTEEKAAAVEEDNPQVSVRVSNPTILSGNNTTTIGAAATAALTSSTNNNNNGSKNSNSNINNKNNSGVSNLNKSRVHECSICGSEFSSGQALGGHMRRHRPAAAVEITKEAKKEKSVLSLDLNLPAPAEDDRGDYLKSPSFPFPGGQPLLFSPSALVDCHY